MNEISRPASNEIKRARELAACLSFSLQNAKRFKLERVTLPIESAEELCQLLHDSLKTVE